MPKRFTSIGAIMFGLIAGIHGARIYYGLDVVVGSFHVPMMLSWAVAVLAALLCVMLFREAEA
jgi:quinol-cytochrome oxidoreductase complex cytochrome b subunit